MNTTQEKPRLVTVREASSTSEFRCADTRLVLQWNTRGAMRTLVIGRGLTELIAPITARWDAVVANGSPLESFLDFGDMDVYDSELRSELTGWGLRNRPKMKSIHAFSRSKIVIMGASLASIALGGMVQVHTDLATFEAAAREAGLPARPATPRTS